MLLFLAGAQRLYINVRASRIAKASGLVCFEVVAHDAA
jgi:hypothetical protein